MQQNVWLLFLFACTDVSKEQDSDNDGLSDSFEEELGTDPQSVDTDCDGLHDGEEVNQYDLDPTNEDTDGDGLNDGDEILLYESDPKNPDSDGDGLNDYEEVVLHESNPNNSDSDGDGLEDYDEVFQYGTSPILEDTDGDGLSDPDEIFSYETNPDDADTDDDGLNDSDELATNCDPHDSDTDDDGLIDGLEVLEYGSNPHQSDTDEDGISDGDEVLEYQTDPTKPDTDDDGLYDLEEIDIYETDPTNRDTDGDGLSDGDEIFSYNTSPLNPDNDFDGFLVEDGDCNNLNPYIHPLAIEIWYDGIDQNCDGANDYDQDGDGYIFSEEHSLSTDCDELDPQIGGELIGYFDRDGDGYGADVQYVCDFDQDGDGIDDLILVGGDCNDFNADMYPNIAQNEDISISSDCLLDSDGDGYGASSDCYLLTMNDTGGDAWEGSFVDFYINDQLFVSHTFSNAEGNGSSHTEEICVPYTLWLDGIIISEAELRIGYSHLSSNSTNQGQSFIIEDSDGIMVYSSGVNPSERGAQDAVLIDEISRNPSEGGADPDDSDVDIWRTRPRGTPDIHIFAFSGHNFDSSIYHEEYLCNNANYGDPVPNMILDIEADLNANNHNWMIDYSCYGDENDFVAAVDNDDNVDIYGFMDALDDWKFDIYPNYVEGYINPTRIVVLGHSHGTVWSHNFIFTTEASDYIPNMTVDFLIDLDGESLLWEEDTLGIGDNLEGTVP